MSRVRSFSTRNGFCLLTDADIYLNDTDQQPDKLPNVDYTRRNHRSLRHLAAALVLLTLAMLLLQPPTHALALVIAFVALVYIGSAFKHRRLSATRRVRRADIIRIVDHPPFPVRAAYFTVHFRAGDDTRQLELEMPFSAADGERHYHAASRMIREMYPDLAAH